MRSVTHFFLLSFPWALAGLEPLTFRIPLPLPVSLLHHYNTRITLEKSFLTRELSMRNVGYREMRSLDRSMCCQLYTNKIRSLLTFKLLSMFNKNTFYRCKLKDISFKKTPSPKMRTSRIVKSMSIRFSLYADFVLILQKRKYLKYGYGPVNAHIRSNLMHCSLG